MSFYSEDRFKLEEDCMKKSWLFAIIILVVVSLACAGTAAEPTPTSTPEIPTSTPEPTDTPTLIPTATPNRTATVQARATHSANEILTELDELLQDTEIPYQEGSLIWKQDKKVDIKMSGPSGQFVDFADGLKSKDFILKSEVTWNSTGLIVCGIMFRSEPNFREGDQYRFIFLRLSGAPAWAIEYYEFGYPKNSPTDTKFSSALNLENDATNEFVLVAQEGEFTIFINGVRQGRFFDYSKQRLEGGFAMIGLQDSGKGSCQYENTWIWELE